MAHPDDGIAITGGDTPPGQPPHERKWWSPNLALKGPRATDSEEKSRAVDLCRRESLGFRGPTFSVRSLQGLEGKQASTKISIGCPPAPDAEAEDTIGVDVLPQGGVQTLSRTVNGARAVDLFHPN
jgi:hypothetical protein